MRSVGAVQIAMSFCVCVFGVCTAADPVVGVGLAVCDSDPSKLVQCRGAATGPLGGSPFCPGYDSGGLGDLGLF